MAKKKIYARIRAYTQIFFLRMITEPLPKPSELIKKLPLAPPLDTFIQDSRLQIQNILKGKDSRLLLIVGPCSIHDTTAAEEYAVKLKRLSNELSDHFFIVMRTYFEKSRTSLGWKGLLHDPDLNGTFNIKEGLKKARSFLLKLAALNLPTAIEFLNPLAKHYLQDLISWGCIGARTASSQTHRQLAASLPMPIGFKNNTDGNIKIAFDSILAASQPQGILDIDTTGALTALHSPGNPNCHIVLRGSDKETNFDDLSIEEALSFFKNHTITPSLLIDCSHGNSKRDHERQPFVFKHVINKCLEENSPIRGALLESFLFEGNQSLCSNLQYGVSITDSCLNWKETEELILWAYERLKTAESEHTLLPEEEWVSCRA